MGPKILPLQDLNSLSQSWLSSVLTNYYDTECQVLSLETKPTGQREGFLSEIAFIKAKIVLNEEEKEDNFVVKCMPQSEKHRIFMKSGSLGEREVDFYKFSQSETFKAVVEKIGVTRAVPEVLYAETEDSNLTIVMKDLKVLNYKTVLSRDGSSLEHTLRMLSSIAVIHASDLYHFKKFDKHSLKKFEDNSYFDQFVEPNMEILIDLFKDTELLPIFKRIAPISKNIRDSMTKNPLFETIVHGDLWAGQCMFSEDEKQVCILDWQFSTIGNPIIDLMAVFFLSSEPIVLEDHLNHVLESYWKDLTTNLDKMNIEHPVNFSEFADCVENHWVTGMLCIIASLKDFLDGDVLSISRLKGIMNFLHKKKVFTKFIQEYEIST